MLHHGVAAVLDSSLKLFGGITDQQNTWCTCRSCWRGAALTHIRPVSHSYRNPSTDLPCRSIDWFLYECDTGLIWVKKIMQLSGISKPENKFSSLSEQIVRLFCENSILQTPLQNPYHTRRVHLFSTYAKFSKTNISYPWYTHVRVCIRG